MGKNIIYNVKQKEKYMKQKVVLSVLVVGVVCSVVAAWCYVQPHKQVSQVNNNHSPESQNMFMAYRGPMMPPPPFMHPHFPGMGPGPMDGEPFGGKIRLTENQRDKIKELDRNLSKDMKKLHDEEEELRDEYREKVDSVLTDEQFRKIEKMRNDLRKDMKKLRQKQRDVMEKHKRDFDSILTPEQKKTLERKHNENHKIQGTKDAGKTGERDDKDPAKGEN